MRVWQFKRYFEYFLSSLGSSFSTLLGSCTHPLKKKSSEQPSSFTLFLPDFNDLWYDCSHNVHILFWWDIQCKKYFCTPPAFPEGSILTWYKGSTILCRMLGEHPPDLPLFAIYTASQGKRFGVMMCCWSNEQYTYFLFYKTLLPDFPKPCEDFRQKTAMCQRGNGPRESASSWNREANWTKQRKQ